MTKHVAIYARVSTARQNTKSQKPDLEAWAAGQTLPVVWYEDKATGKNMDRPGWQRLEAAMRAGKVAKVVCWRLDRLGRSVRGLTTLFDELTERKVDLVSLKDGLDLNTATGRLVANVLASIAQFESELRSERVLAGQAVARSNGKRWGGHTPKHGRKVTPEQVKAIRQLKAEGTPITRIANAVKLSRPTVYEVLRAAGQSNAPSTATAGR